MGSEIEGCKLKGLGDGARMREQTHASDWEMNPSKTAAEWLEHALTEESDYRPFRLVLDHGTNFKPTARPDEIVAGEPMCCFANAFELAKSRPDLRYAEGYVTVEGDATGLRRHGWCVDCMNSVVDPTKGFDDPLPLAYRGLVLPLDLVEGSCHKYSDGFVDDPDNVAAIERCLEI